MGARTNEIEIDAAGVVLHGALEVPDAARGVVPFAHGSGSSRYSPRNQMVAQNLREDRLRSVETPVGNLSGLLEQKAPSVNVVDRAKEVLVRAEVPGIDREDLDVSIVDRTLTINGSSRQEEKKDLDCFCQIGSADRQTLSCGLA